MASGRESDGGTRKEGWRKRRSVRQLKKEATDSKQYSAWDTRENDESRLRASEAIHLGGIVLTEAFTPSTVSSLYRALEHLPSRDPARRQEWLEALARSRTGQQAGWQNLGVVRNTASPMMPSDLPDPDLPSGVEAVWLHVSHVIPAMAMVVATFTLTEEAGDLSELLRRDYSTEEFDVRLRVEGRFGGLRARIPWARPARHGMRWSISRPDDQKRKACTALTDELEERCVRWFASRFPGRFAVADPRARPVIKMMFTKEDVPYSGKCPGFGPVGLGSAYPVWGSTEMPGWWLAEQRGFRDGEREHVMTLATRRSDAVSGDDDREADESNWHLTQRFARDGAPLAAHRGILALMSLYASRLAALRDKAGTKRFIRRPVRDARALDEYLIRDGLDAATVTSDLKQLTEDLTRFRQGLPEFTEEQGDRGPPADPDHSPLEYVPVLRERIRNRAARLASDTLMTTGNIRASAELRQAIANTVLQRAVVVISLVAIIRTFLD